MRLRRLLPALLVMAAAPACKKKAASADEDIAKLVELKDRMCACKRGDRGCADRVSEDLNRWSKEWGDRAGSKRTKMSPADMKKMEEVGMQYGVCMTTAFDTGTGSSAMPPAPSPPDEKVTNADRLIKLTFDGVEPGYAVSKLVLSYVRADGTIDETYGVATVELGKPAPADDPDRPIGAPLPAAPPSYVATERCPSFTWKRGVRTTGQTSCPMLGAEGITRPKCSVVEVWKRAIEKGAPAKALAVLELVGPPGQTWKLSIDDAPRKIHFAIDVEDTCEPTLEAPR